MRMPPQPQFSGRLVAAPDGPRRNFHTLNLMRQIIDASKTNPRIIAAAHSIVYLTPERDELHEARALFEYVRDHIRYVKDVVGVETLCAPQMTLQRMTGDCDDQTMLLCALYESIGYPTRLVMARYYSDDWEHVFCQVLANGQWWYCDPIERKHIFGEAPANPLAEFVEAVY